MKIHVPLRPAAIEVLDDLEERFEGRASVADMVDWLGRRPFQVKQSFEALERRGWVKRVGVDTFEAQPVQPGLPVPRAPRKPYPPRPLPYDVTAVRSALASGREQYLVRRQFNLTVGTVAGIAWRMRVGALT